MVKLSYSTINMVYRHPHCWLNRMLGLKPEERPEWKRGRDGHRIIQDHVSGKKKHPKLEGPLMEWQFPIVEEVPFDKRCYFEFNMGQHVPQLGDYLIRGYLDGHNPAEKRMLEIKISNQPWSIEKFFKSPQRMVYALAFPEYTESLLVTTDESFNNLRLHRVDLTEGDRLWAISWIAEGIKIIESGDFKSDLQDGKCNGYCYYGRNCQFL